MVLYFATFNLHYLQLQVLLRTSAVRSNFISSPFKFILQHLSIKSTTTILPSRASGALFGNIWPLYNVHIYQDAPSYCIFWLLP